MTGPRGVAGAPAAAEAHRTPSQGIGKRCPGLGRARGGEGAPWECASDLHVGITRLHS